MSWDVMIFRFAGRTPTAEEFERGEVKLVPLGSARQVRDAISRVLPDVDWGEPTWGIYDGDGFSITFNVGEEDPVRAVMLNVRGGGDPIAAMLSFATPNGWSLLDCSTDQFIDPDGPSQEGWERFQKLRDQVARHLQRKGKGRRR